MIGAAAGFPAAPQDLPVGLRLEQNHPDPFNPRTEIRFSVAEAGPVRLAVFEMTLLR